MGGTDDDPFFPGEPYLLDATIPNYPREWAAIKIKLTLTAAFFVVVVPAVIVPFLFSSTKDGTGEGGKSEEEAKANVAAATAIATATAAAPVDTAKRRRGKKKSSSSRQNGGKTDDAHRTDASSPAGKEQGAVASAAPSAPPTVVVPPFFMPAMNVLCLVIMFLIVANSPNNRYAAKHVFHAPLLTPDECDTVIRMAHEAAERNYLEAIKDEVIVGFDGAGKDGDDRPIMDKKIRAKARRREEEGRRIVDEPRGWRKDRHTAYPTTDLNLVTDHFAKEDREWIREKLDARLAPVIERVYGITPAAIRANDMFVVRYDAKIGQQSLRVHKDSSHVSFNVLLNDEFEGGGTRYHEIKGGKRYDLKPDRGEVLLNNALVLHEGLPVTSGTRYIMVGFMNVDTIDPLTSQPTGIGALASWLSAPWAVVRFKAGMESARHRRRNVATELKRWTDNKYLIALFDDMHSAFSVIMDLWAPFTFTQLVDDSNKTEYFAALDDSAAAAVKEEDRRTRRANWFKGQQLDLDIDGSVARLWRTRQEAGEGMFADL